MTTDTDILIAGAGLNGGSLALALAAGGHRVTLVDPAPAGPGPQNDGRGYALSAASVNVLRGLGLWDELARGAEPIREVRVSDGRAGQRPSPFVLEMHEGEIEEGHLGHMVEDRALRPAIDAALEAAGVRRLTGAKVVGEDRLPARIDARLDDGGTVSARLLVGADGRLSGVAARAGIRHVRFDYDQISLVTAISHERPHGGIAQQLFLPEGPLAILPLPGDRSSIVWTERRDRARAIAALDEAGYLDALRTRIGGYLGDIALAGPRTSFPLSLSLAHSFVAPRTALLGDAAHAVHPLAGQGLNAGLKDVAALAQVLTDARRRGEDIGRPEVLERYQQWRRFDAAQLAFATDGFNRLFSNDLPGLRLLRDIGLGAIGALPALRRTLIREAAGLTGDLPRLAQGRPL